jgi:hypothetical protein
MARLDESRTCASLSVPWMAAKALSRSSSWGCAASTTSGSRSTGLPICRPRSTACVTGRSAPVELAQAGSVRATTSSSTWASHLLPYWLRLRTWAAQPSACSPAAVGHTRRADSARRTVTTSLRGKSYAPSRSTPLARSVRSRDVAGRPSPAGCAPRTLCIPMGSSSATDSRLIGTRRCSAIKAASVPYARALTPMASASRSTTTTPAALVSDRVADASGHCSARVATSFSAMPMTTPRGSALRPTTSRHTSAESCALCR